MEACPQLLDLIPKDAEGLKSRDKDGSHGSSEEKKLELRLGPPGEHWFVKDTSKSNKKRDESLLSLGYFSSVANKNNVNNGDQNYKFSSSQQNPVGCILSSPWSSSYYQKSIHETQQQTKAPSYLQFPSVPHQSLPVVSKEASQICGSKGIELQSNLSEKKIFSKSPANTAVPNASQKRTAPASVVGWPPIRSFRKNIASSSSKPSNESQTAVQNKVSGEKTVESCRIGMFVKINMDGVPIGRKVDLNAYDNYEKLSSSVDELFRDLLAAQKDSSAGGIRNEGEEKKEIKGVLDGSGEYTLVYEDNEGDRMLVGDVPWHMFVSTVKRLRVLKSSELPMLSLGSKQDKIPVNSKMEEEF